MKLKKLKVNWKGVVDDHDIAAATEYMQLYNLNLWGMSSHTQSFYAKDILRASELKLLPITNYHVKKDIQKIKAGETISPIVLAQINFDNIIPKLVVADGYHRVCAVYHISEDIRIPTQIYTFYSY